jgi:hypothetical protein
MGTSEALLRSEISFWQELITSCDGTQAPETLERMHQALALAQRRLERLFGGYQRARTSGREIPDNVYRLRSSA